MGCRKRILQTRSFEGVFARHKCTQGITFRSQQPEKWWFQPVFKFCNGDFSLEGLHWTNLMMPSEHAPLAWQAAVTSKDLRLPREPRRVEQELEWNEACLYNGYIIGSVRCRLQLWNATSCKGVHFIVKTVPLPLRKMQFSTEARRVSCISAAESEGTGASKQQQEYLIDIQSGYTAGLYIQL